MDFVDEFRSAAVEFGLADFTPIPDGEIHRVDLSDEKRGRESGWYVLHPDEPQAGSFGNWKTGETTRWRTNKKSTVSREEVETNRKRREAEHQARLKEAAERAMHIWSEAKPCETHPYLERKQVLAHNVKIHGDALVVPVWQPDRSISSLQFINAEGNKKFLKGGMISGGFHIIGRPTDRMYIAEGYATAASVHEQTGDAVLVAFNAGNMPSVALNARKLFPDTELIVAADNDESGTGERYAKATNLPYVMPEETGDFNDHPMVTEPVESVDLYTPLPDANSKGKPLQTIENLAEIVRRLNITVRYNVITKEEEIIVPGARYSVDNQANSSFAYIESWCDRFGFPTGKLQSFLTHIADLNQFNPIMQWIESTPWDSHPRLNQFADTIKSTNDELKRILLRRWMLSAVAAVASSQGVSAHGVLVLQGNQYVGKTKWFKSLVPPSMQQYIQDGLMLDPKDRDSKVACLSNWLVELGELDATFRKADIANLKAFITQQNDTLRRAYARKESHYARRTVFFASVNPKEYLHDPTGNRRFWTIEALEIDHSHSIDMQQVWAEVYEAYRQGESWFLKPEEMVMLNEHNSDFETIDPIEEAIRSKFDWSRPGQGLSLTSTEILYEIGIDKPNKGQVNACSQIVTKVTGEKSRKTTKGRRVWEMPPLEVR